MAKFVLNSVSINDRVTVKGNQWGLVYDGAITENVDGQVNIHPVSYLCNHVTVDANIYTPANYDPNKKYPALTVAHPNGGVKEQVAGLFAQKLAENGYIAIAADAAYQGNSGGEPRLTDKPAYRIEDVRGMADALSVFPGVDYTRLGAFGICGGGGYTLAAGQTDKRFKVIATLSAFNTGVVRRDGFCVSEANTIQARLTAASKAREKAVQGGEVEMSASIGDMTPEQIKNLPYDMYREGAEYYGLQYAHPKAGGIYPVSDLQELTSFDAAANMNLINVPLLMMAGSAADSLYLTEDAYVKATSEMDKELFLIKGAHHIQTYWVPKYVQQESDKLMDWLSTRL
ncbi:alpha/beta hydrolase [Pediococcus ethanolidurans]|uniref:alpha/beta hydrolase n=1 Tax=Pediococcus ethanolidurans TaxID=319653 RepID=UPI00295365B4|nr:alpha/beta hydrolase [Pediococcus ethanolidurans]MDV7719335.1 alpha/beta hydrolase [Pediococcus ethanolidurans]